MKNLLTMTLQQMSKEYVLCLDVYQTKEQPVHPLSSAGLRI